MTYSKWLEDKRIRDQLEANPAVNPKMRDYLQKLNDDMSWSSSSSSSSSSSLSSSSSSSSSSSLSSSSSSLSSSSSA